MLLVNNQFRKGTTRMSEPIVIAKKCEMNDATCKMAYTACKEPNVLHILWMLKNNKITKQEADEALQPTCLMCGQSNKPCIKRN